MRFALLGDDPRALSLARGVLSDPRHQLLATAHAPQCHAELLTFDLRLDACRTWEELLTGTPLDAVIVSGDNEDVLRGARQLAAAGKALLVLPTPGQTSTFVYELALLHGESPVVLFPVFPLREHPLVLKLRSLITGGTLGRVRHLQWTREIAANEVDDAVMSPAAVAAAFLCDADLLRFLGGDYDQVNATRSGDDRGISLATISLGGTNVPQAVWSASVAIHAEKWRLVVAGELATCALLWDAQLGELQLESVSGRETASEKIGEMIQPVLEKFSRVCAGESQRQDWTDMTRAFELLDAVERSVRRRRTIDLHFEAPSERSLFKTQMTALGCGLLTATLFAVVLFLIVAAAFDLNETVKQVLRVLIFAPLGLFLALQLLLFVAKPGRGGGKKT